VEKKLSKDHYSPEIIYLLFQIQSILLEKENGTNILMAHEETISELKKDLIAEKTLIGDLKDSIKENTTELDEIETDYTEKLKVSENQYKVLSKEYERLNWYKTLYEKIMMYLLPMTTFIIYVWVCKILSIINYYFTKLNLNNI
jgi:chromosome segregation ATPase